LQWSSEQRCPAAQPQRYPSGASISREQTPWPVVWSQLWVPSSQAWRVGEAVGAEDGADELGVPVGATVGADEPGDREGRAVGSVVGVELVGGAVGSAVGGEAVGDPVSRTQVWPTVLQSPSEQRCPAAQPHRYPSGGSISRKQTPWSVVWSQLWVPSSQACWIGEEVGGPVGSAVVGRADGVGGGLVQAVESARSYASEAIVNPEPVGAPEPPCQGEPHATMLPSAARTAAKAAELDRTASGENPEPVGAPEPPHEGLPHATMHPSAGRTAAKA
jgi:hypothetical protein